MCSRRCNLLFVSGSSVGKGLDNLLISNVMTKVQDNESDDDVIEVERDDAPIEILSDGEELELEKIKQAQNTQQNVNVIQNFHFTSLPSESHDKEPTLDEPNIDETNIDVSNIDESNIDVSNLEIDVNRCDEEDHIIDPLTHDTETITNDIANCNNLLPFGNPLLPSLFDSTPDSNIDNDNKSNHSDHDEENVYVNVTDDVNMNEPTQSDIAMDFNDQNNEVEQNQTPVENSCNSVNSTNDVPEDMALKTCETVTENENEK